MEQGPVLAARGRSRLCAERRTVSDPPQSLVTSPASATLILRVRHACGAADDAGASPGTHPRRDREVHWPGAPLLQGRWPPRWCTATRSVHEFHHAVSARLHSNERAEGRIGRGLGAGGVSGRRVATNRPLTPSLQPPPLQRWGCTATVVQRGSWTTTKPICTSSMPALDRKATQP